MHRSVSHLSSRSRLLLMTLCFTIQGATAGSVALAADPAPSVAAPATPAPATVPVRIASIEVKGNVVTPTEAVLAASGVKAGDEVPSDKLQARIQESLTAIYDLGTVADAKANLVQFRNGMTLTYTIQENPKIVAVELRGNTIIPSPELMPLVLSKAGSVADRKAIGKDLEALGKGYQDKGYSLGDVTVQMDDAGKLVYTVVEARIGAIKITGNTKTKEYVIRRELISQSGNPLDTNRVRVELRRIYNLGFFEEVNPKIEPTDKPGLVDYTIELKEQKTGRYGGSVAYAVNEGLLGNLTIENPNIMGRGQALNLNLEAGLKGSRTLEAGFREPRLRGTNTSFDARVFSKDVKQTDYMAVVSKTLYTEHKTGWTMTFGRALAENDRVSGGLGSEYTSNRGENGSPYLLQGAGRTNYLDLGYTRDTRDNVMDAKSGYRLAASTRLAGGPLQGENDFARYEGSLSAYQKVLSTCILAGRVSAGQVKFQGANPPAQEVFRLGGADTVRGYDYGDMHGDSMVYTNLEFRIPATKAGSAVVLFTDAGRAWDASAGTDPIKVSAGLGVRIGTPMGPIRLDYGWGKEDTTGKLKGKLHFSFGQTF